MVSFEFVCTFCAAILFCNIASGSEEETFLKENDFLRAKWYPQSLDPEDRHNPVPWLFEGCFSKLNPGKLHQFLTTAEMNTVQDSAAESPLFADAMPDRYQLWPEGIIPYAISTRFTLHMRTQIAAAIQDFHRLTCIRFRPRRYRDFSYVFITPMGGYGCSSDTVGRQGGRQIVNLDESSCSQKGTVIHELLHVVGMFHEHSRSDRDYHISINYENIAQGQQDQFTKYSIPLLDSLQTAYDFNSVMHYPSGAFSWNGRNTITTRPPGLPIGQRTGFSTIDSLEVNRLYCPSFVPRKRISELVPSSSLRAKLLPQTEKNKYLFAQISLPAPSPAVSHSGPYYPPSSVPYRWTQTEQGKPLYWVNRQDSAGNILNAEHMNVREYDRLRGLWNKIISDPKVRKALRNDHSIDTVVINDIQ